VDVGDTTAATLEGLENGVLYDTYVLAYDQFGNRTNNSNLISIRPNCWGAVDGESESLERFVLGRNYPNPFGSRTTIPYRVTSSKSLVRLVVYDAKGGKVRALQDGHLPAGRYEATWDGTDRRGLPVPAGVYFCRLEVAGLTATSKMLLVK
jgi:hypothetical protein